MNVVSLDHLTNEEINEILDLADEFSKGKKVSYNHEKDSGTSIF